MHLRCFALDPTNQLRTARLGAIRAVLAGEPAARAFRCPVGSDLHLVSVVCDGRLLPKAVYLLRVPLTGGRFTPEDALALQALASPDYVTPAEAARHHGLGWPADLVRQLAVALDVPVARLGVPFTTGGGPALIAAVRRVSFRRALRDLR